MIHVTDYWYKHCVVFWSATMSCWWAPQFHTWYSKQQWGPTDQRSEYLSCPLALSVVLQENLKQIYKKKQLSPSFIFAFLLLLSLIACNFVSTGAPHFLLSLFWKRFFCCWQCERPCSSSSSCLLLQYLFPLLNALCLVLLCLWLFSLLHFHFLANEFAATCCSITWNLHFCSIIFFLFLFYFNLFYFKLLWFSFNLNYFPFYCL